MPERVWPPPKGLCPLKGDSAVEKCEKIIFLDIDGVIQGYGNGQRFKRIASVPELQKELTVKYGIDYEAYNKYDIGAVYYDWNPHAISLLKKMLHATGAKIVISSDWRLEGLQRMKDFFRLYDLHEYVIDATDNIDLEEIRARTKGTRFIEFRAMEILDYVEKHPEIKRFVAIDDMNLSEGLEGHFVRTSHLITDEQCDRCIEILGVVGE